MSFTELDKSVQKHYLALVHGDWPESLLEIDAPLQKNQLSSGERMVRVDPQGINPWNSAWSRMRPSSALVYLRHWERGTRLQAIRDAC